eukprot:CAMPEP_0114557046 /NCGR_PEP_ID=MMETSP0114-20121206/9615_1 /TAXON_ID=31324 /ORGANISM="Goniomonas sp, Strain m" /LENGTH=254 /DNA_ID=CAMNT_0001742295 /DNA_START=16 /DNA_END=780 /DNA_ORIENTATION=-
MVVQVLISDSAEAMGKEAAKRGVAAVNAAIQERGEARVVLATGASQFPVLENVLKEQVDWTKVTLFHLDEYVGLSSEHPASFRKYLRERFLDKVPTAPKEFHFCNGEAADIKAECARLNELISVAPIDVSFIGIGENGHLAFNDPPCDAVTKEPYIIVTLDEGCRKQQVGEGWFKSMDEVPEQAISMSIQHILTSKKIICSVPDKRKAAAVKGCLEGPVTPQVPASYLQGHADTLLLLDTASASELEKTHPTVQ